MLIRPPLPGDEQLKDESAKLRTYLCWALVSSVNSLAEIFE